MNGNAWCHANGPCAHISHPVGNGGEDVFCDVLPMLGLVSDTIGSQPESGSCPVPSADFFRDFCLSTIGPPVLTRFFPMVVYNGHHAGRPTHGK